MNTKKYKNYSAFLRLLIVLLVLGSIIPNSTLAQSPPIVVIYPDIREPYRSVFNNIINGIDSGIQGSVQRYELQQNYSLSALKNWLDQKRAKVVITLGKRGLRAAMDLPSTLQIVIGAVLNSSNPIRYSGIMLTPDPEIVFEKLRTLVPSVRRITVIYSREHNEWLIQQAQEAAKRRGLALNVYAAADLRQAAIMYRDILNRLAGSSDAIWLLQDDSVLDENSILPLILQRAWDKNLVVFSSNPVHVRKGVLFSLYPDNFGMGRSLAALALNQLRSGGATIMPLRDLLIAVNLRTAEHLGLNISSQERREFDLIFPSP